MKRNRALKTLPPDAWGLKSDTQGQLCAEGCRLSELARLYGTPLYVLNEVGLEAGAREFVRTTRQEFGEQASVHYAMKCNGVPEVVRIVRQSGLNLEVMTPFELALALQMGCPGSKIIANGPCKTPEFLQQCIEAEVMLIVADSLDELSDIETLASRAGQRADVLLRVNIDYTPHGLNRGSAAASRRGSVFGLDLVGGEVKQALIFCCGSCALHFRGFHFHIGTGIRDPQDFRNALRCLPEILRQAKDFGLAVEFLDVGGGFAARTTREMTSREMLLYQSFGRLPDLTPDNVSPPMTSFLREIHRAIERLCPSGAVPHVIFEPGRAIASPHQMLLLTAHRIKNRPGAGKWLITDGGLGTVTLPTFYECHEVFLCNDTQRPRTEQVTISGPACFAGDIVYRNKCMPDVRAGEVLALMDTGAYFNALESSFGYPHPAIVGVRDGCHRVLRRRETYVDMTVRDVLLGKNHKMEVENGVCADTN